jgi:hypothetical protein
MVGWTILNLYVDANKQVHMKGIVNDEGSTLKFLCTLTFGNIEFETNKVTYAL